MVKKPAAFFKEVWRWIKSHKDLTIFTLIISLVGGGPGLINIYQWATDKPGFTFYSTTFDGGMYTFPKSGLKNGTDSIQVFIISGAIYNDGREPLFPIEFKLNLQFEDVDTVTSIYSDNAPDTLFKGNAAYRFENAVDIMRITKLASNDAAWGVIYFPFGRNYLHSNVKPISLTCIDIKEVERTAKIPPVINSNHQSFHVPKTGERFINKP